MKHIYCVVSEENIFANIQQYDFPVLMDYDLTNKRKWKPLFISDEHVRKYYPKGLQASTVQTSPLMYTQPMSDN